MSAPVHSAATELGHVPSAPSVPAIDIRGLSKSYRRHLAVDRVDLEVEPGQVFGYLGPNGAGKTTTIRVLAGLLQPTAGSVRVMGYDIVRERDMVQRRIGYLPGDFVAYADLTGEGYLRFLARLRPGVEWSVARGLADRLGLDLGRKIATLSHGNRQKVGIVQALMHRPDVVILDEPTSGLDPLVQREFLTLLREVRDEGRTVFLSSHVLSEVEAVADTVAILRQGRLVGLESVEGLKARTRQRLDLTFRDAVPAAALEGVPGVRDVVVAGTTAHITVEGSTATLLEVAAPHHIERVVTHAVDLEEIFLSYYEGGTT